MIIELQQIAGRHPAAGRDTPPALKNVSFSVQAGEQVAIIGPSGAGKTTLLHLLACALEPVAGKVLLDHTNPWSLNKRGLRNVRRNLFLAPQVPPLPPRQRVVTAVLAGKLPHMGLWTSLRSLFYPIDTGAAHAALARFDLSEKLFERVDRLSGGERQRVGLARGLVSGANMFLVDEPLSALDPARAEQAMQTLAEVAREQGATLISTLHQVDMALKHFPRIIGLRDGEVVFDLPASEVTEQRLVDLYAQHLDELTGPAPERPPTQNKPAPVAMNCR
ncbi:MAG: ATP-binding cassette domain-containing protein [Gammaproteobacteria bacterium]|nr:ATP-binding cassette domain-containing protein [Gammaproteobacteria bacterium]MBU0847953.1 ATP-binding cassette domain-containing protein [Gammaproteobacteria bacterium]MBU1268927.1 ATP-binding cassette domain-containing protein [Gammaproteobacteria bacterium]MBU1529739.1 ATP-binding cassette domain-containing protein [Gammaproteobacteria bacterium]MBU1780010.1 ATP-binding cassette domain-containing protein [Gammaproteobacteria bacterium]